MLTSIPYSGMDGFNRYMVECEFSIGFFCDNKSDVLIDTWWNVNYSGMDASARVNAVLIDTWWNVNLITLLHTAGIR